MSQLTAIRICHPWPWAPWCLYRLAEHWCRSRHENHPTTYAVGVVSQRHGKERRKMVCETVSEDKGCPKCGYASSWANDGACTHDLCWGGCPVCGRNDGFLNVGRDHWFRCDAHKTCWWHGSNIFSGWRDENEEIWRQNVQLLGTYTKVEAISHWSDLWPRPLARSAERWRRLCCAVSAAVRWLRIRLGVIVAGGPSSAEDDIPF